MKRLIRILGVFLLLAVLAGGGYWYFRIRPAPGPTTASGEFTQVVAGEGRAT